MPVFQFPCPHCEARLRVPDRSFQGREFHCPECRAVIRVVADAEGGLKAVPRDAPAPDAGITPSAAPPESGLGDVRPPAGAKVPRRIAWAVAACLLVAIVIAVIRSGGGDGHQPVAEQNVARPDANAVDAERENVVQNGDPVATDNEDDPAEEMDPLAAQLKVLWSDIEGYRDEHGHYPPGAVDGEDLAEAERFSWLAALWVQTGRAPAVPLWNEGWRAPLNRPFSQSELPAVINPLSEAPEIADRFPVTQFVGVAGVGADAARLPAEHPRAGIFGESRQTRLEDIRDGTANTMLVAGVTDPGPWAAAGRSTVRPFTKEPYVNGPDGFGTGQPDSMLVLMADGSVRTISADTSPVIVRRMAAMADGLPLDPAVNGEPGDSDAAPPQLAEQPPMPPAPMPEPAGNAPPPDAQRDDPRADEPILVELAPDEPTYDVDGALSRTVIAFEQPTPVEFITLLRQLQELAGVPFQFDFAVAEERLREEVTLSAQNVSIGDVLALLLEKTGLRYEARRDGVHILEAGDAPPMPDE